MKPANVACGDSDVCSTASRREAGHAPAPAAKSEPVRLLIVFNTLCLYGLERCVIETFDQLRPHVHPLFLLPLATQRYSSLVLQEIQRRGLPYSFFSDHFDWPRIGRPRSWRDAWQILHAVVRANVDVLRAARGQDTIYIPIVTGLYFSMMAAAWFRLKRKKVLYSCLDQIVKRSRRLWLGRLWVSDIVYLTRTSYSMAVRANPFLANKRHHVIPPVVALQPLTGEVRSTLSEYAGRCNVVFIGQVSKHKGVDVLLGAFERIATRFGNATLHIVGGSAYEYEGDFAAAIARTKFAGQIHHWGYCSDVRPFLEIASVYVQPSLPSLFHESFGRGVVEAMSMGVPAITFRSGSLAEIVEHERTGLLCEVESPDCLAANIERLLADPDLRDRLGQRAKERFQQAYSSERICERWLELFKPRIGLTQ